MYKTAAAGVPEMSDSGQDMEVYRELVAAPREEVLFLHGIDRGSIQK